MRSVCPGLPQFEQRADVCDVCRVELVVRVSAVDVMRLEEVVCCEEEGVDEAVS